MLHDIVLLISVTVAAWNFGHTVVLATAYPRADLRISAIGGWLMVLILLISLH
jgi:hypothetical protein